MFSKLTIHLRPWLILFIIPLFLSACGLGEAEPAIPLPKGIPNDDIVYMPPTGDTVHAPYNGINEKTLGFINADGTDQIDYNFKIFQGARSNFGERLYVQQADYPRWSRSGTMLAFSVRGLPPDIRLIDSDGRMYGQKCDALDQVSTFDSKGNILGEITKNSSVYPEYQNKITEGTSLVARYDLKTCAIVSVFSISVPQDAYPWNISEAENGLVTAEFYILTSYTHMIMIFNPMTRDLTSFAGYDPSLSIDGAWLAYFNYSGNLVVRNIESGLEKSIINVLPTDTAGFDYGEFDYLSMPGWSPDNKWLVYNTEDGKIYKVNIETGENVYITDGWAPDWRP